MKKIGTAFAFLGIALLVAAVPTEELASGTAAILTAIAGLICVVLGRCIQASQEWNS